MTELLSFLHPKEKLSVNDYKKFQMDFVSPYAKKITKYILAAFKDVKITDKNLAASLQMFKDWNYEMNEFSQVPTIYATFLKYLLKNIFEDEMGHDLYNEFVFVANVPYRSLERVLKIHSAHGSITYNTPQVESENEIIRKSLSDALTELETKHGKDIENWQWGTVHKVTFKHAFSGVSGLLDNVIDIGPLRYRR